ncbi:hypothetical protein FACS189459_1530 [Bacilli bacterium]|nr:hypothetical protein FACS189459_1530 [Bacilli bacterium]
MRILIDTNILYKMYICNNSKIATDIFFLKANNHLYVDNYCVSELINVIYGDINTNSSNTTPSYSKKDKLKQISNIYKDEISIFENLIFSNNFNITFNTKHTFTKCRDIKDNDVINAALNIGADCIITDDKDLLILDKKINNISIVPSSQIQYLY